MTRPGLMTFSMVATLAVLGSARADLRDGRVGSACHADADCADGVLCWPPDGAGGPQGPAGGLCSAPCATDSDCSHDNAAACLNGICLETCNVGAPAPGHTRLEKCHGRDDVGCAEYCTDFSCASTRGLCSPQCATHEQCGEGRFCDQSSGLCQESPPMGDPPGSACGLYSGATTCKGTCIFDYDAYYQQQVEVGICVEICILGTESACAPSDTTDQARACVLPLDPSYDVGDQGICANFCDCNSDCADHEVCEPWDLGDVSAAAGVCAAGIRQPGSPECLNAGGQAGAAASCSFGPVRACKTEDCLGTARCLPSGEYSDCECLASADPGGAGGQGPDGDPAVAPNTGASNCACRAPGALPSAGLLWLLGFLVAPLRRRLLRSG